MKDTYDRDINYLRISVTDRCNLECSYCPAPPVFMARKDILSYEELTEVAFHAVSMGVTKIRITGGEPLVRKNITDFVKMLSVLDIRDLSMTTIVIMLDSVAGDLKSAGLDRINISLDAMDPAHYRRITRGGDVRRVLSGIEAAVKAGLAPVKINCVVHSGPDEPNARDVAAFARRNDLDVRFIRIMNTATGEFSKVIGGTGGNCPACNRLRLTANGMIRPCLFNDLAFSVRRLGPRRALVEAVKSKPENGTYARTSYMRAIGG